MPKRKRVLPLTLMAENDENARKQLDEIAACGELVNIMMEMLTPEQKASLANDWCESEAFRKKEEEKGT